MTFESNILFLLRLTPKKFAVAYFTRINSLAKLLPVDLYVKIVGSTSNRQLVWGFHDKRTFFARPPSLYTDLSWFISCLFITEGNPDTHKAIRSRLDNVGIRNENFNLTGGLHSEWNWEPWFTPTMEVTENFIHSVFMP